MTVGKIVCKGFDAAENLLAVFEKSLDAQSLIDTVTRGCDKFFFMIRLCVVGDLLSCARAEVRNFTSREGKCLTGGK